MRLTELRRTTSFQLAILFLALFSAASLALFSFLYWQTKDYMQERVDTWLATESQGHMRMSASELAHDLDARAIRHPDLDQAFMLYDSTGRQIAGPTLTDPISIPVFDHPFTFILHHGTRNTHFRGLAHRLPTGEALLLTQNMHEFREFDEVLINAILWGGLITAGLGLVGAVILGAGTVRRIDNVVGAIQRIVNGDLSGRLPSSGQSGDLNRLVSVVNAMLDDIERLMHEVKGVCDNVAHDMRTPLTRLLAGLERASRRAESTEQYAAAIDDAVLEIRSILKTFSALLRISEIEDGARRAGFTAVDLMQIVSDVAEFYQPLADERQIVFTLRKAGLEPFSTTGDASLLFEAISNLVDNAIKFTPEHGRVEISVEKRYDNLSVAVTDSGSGILPEERDAVLLRFHRGEKSRHTAGNGLGLSIVAAVARLHHMQLTIKDASPGCLIELRLKQTIFSPV